MRLVLLNTAIITPIINTETFLPMSAEAPAFDINGKHDRLPRGELRDLRLNSLAVAAEYYASCVADFRRRFFSKLIDSCSFSNGFGWAIFDDSGTGNVSTLGQREVLITSRLRSKQETTTSNAGDVPLIRLITNEPYKVTGKLFYLTQDVTVLESGSARYLVDAARIIDAEIDETPQERGSNVRSSYSPLFFMLTDSDYLLTENAGLITPKMYIQGPEDNAVPVTPFGTSDNITDRFYALEQAEAILGSIGMLEPVHWYDRPAA